MSATKRKAQLRLLSQGLVVHFDMSAHSMFFYSRWKNYGFSEKSNAKAAGLFVEDLCGSATTFSRLRPAYPVWPMRAACVQK